MSLHAYQQCIIPTCGATYDFGEITTECKKCGNLLDIQYEWDKITCPKDLRFYESRRGNIGFIFDRSGVWRFRSEEHTSELQSHSFISYAVFCLKKKIK